MRHFIGYTIVALIAAIALGCGSGKELPDVVPHTKEAGVTSPDPVEKAPEASDPAAKAIADRAIKAITQNQPDLLVKARNCKLTAHGLFQLPPKNQTMTEAKCIINSMWPDRGQITYDFGGSHKLVFGKRGVFGWWVNSPLPYVAPSELAQVIQTDLMAQQWFLVGLGLAESGAVFFDPKNEKTAKSSTTTIKVGLKDLLVYRVAFDDQSGLPVRIEYAPLEIGQRVRVKKVISASDPMLASGLMLPTTISLTQNEQLAYRWTVDHWDFPEKMDDSVFDPPK